MKKFKFFFIVSIVLVFSQCTYDNENDYFKDNLDICYTENRSFNNDVLPVVENNCFSCHNSSNSSGGINLENYENIKFIAESGKLLGTINHDVGYSAMPLNSSKLSDCTINQIEAWIKQGLKNN